MAEDQSETPRVTAVGPAVGARPRKRSGLRPLKLRHLLFLLLLLSGIIPLAISSLLLIQQNREILETQEKSYLTRSAQFLSVELNQSLVGLRRQLDQLGRALEAIPSAGSAENKLREPWLVRYLQDFLVTNPAVVVLRVLDPDGKGPYSAAPGLSRELLQAMDEAFTAARGEPVAVYRFLVLPGTNHPLVILVVPVRDGVEEPPLYVEAAARLPRMQSLFAQEARSEVAVFLVDREGELLWSSEEREEVRRALSESRLVRDFVGTPLNMTQEYPIEIEGRRERMIGRVSPVEETGWGVVVHRPAAAAFSAVREMAWKTAISTAVLVVLALSVAAVAARQVSRPIQELTGTTHEIAAGNFGKRVEAMGPGQEIVDLAADFNRMSGHVQNYVDQLRSAARANQELFIGSMRSFVAAIDAKDPYTRGHSERVAAYSRTIAKHLGLSEDAQQTLWVGALLHDVGKIGVEDRVLRKGGVLSEEEYEQMKLHPSLGAEIMSRIEQLRQMIPAIRWHHEAWNGRGYPDGLRGEQIPLMARIVGVADTFDAITTNRPYQRAYEPDFAVETITRLVGARFDAKVVTAFLRAFEAGQIQKRRAPVAPETPQAPQAVLSG